MLSGIFYRDVQFFRFYKDGVFLDCLIKARRGPVPTYEEKEQIYSWFDRKKPSKGTLVGRYAARRQTAIRGDIRFNTPGHFWDGRLTEYVGKYDSKVLILTSPNHNTGRRLENQVFTRLSFNHPRKG